LVRRRRPRDTGGITVPKEGLHVGTAIHRAVKAVKQLAEDIEAPRRMRDVGVAEEAIPRMAEDAMNSPHIARNPRAIEREDLITICERAY